MKVKKTRTTTALTVNYTKNSNRIREWVKILAHRVKPPRQTERKYEKDKVWKLIFPTKEGTRTNLNKRGAIRERQRRERERGTSECVIYLTSSAEVTVTSIHHNLIIIIIMMPTTIKTHSYTIYYHHYCQIKTPHSYPHI